MWNVNVLVYYHTRWKRRFYLNYVECKCKGDTYILLRRSEFYLNYVECKFRRFCVMRGITGGFYLNYVECKLSLKLIKAFPPAEFYLNYVECKSRSFSSCSLTTNRFIWTMWNVNGVRFPSCLGQFAQFYLNYVECKWYWKGDKKMKKIRFYLNYVECKWRHHREARRRKLGFIWTMWNVNLFSCNVNSCPLFCVLSELCGM